jgi:hypothetical protein
MTDMHYLIDIRETFMDAWEVYEKKWNILFGDKVVTEYFAEQWVDSVFNMWGADNTDSGNAGTNNPCESENAIVKLLEYCGKTKWPTAYLIPIMARLVKDSSDDSKRRKPFAHAPLVCHMPNLILYIGSQCYCPSRAITYERWSLSGRWSKSIPILIGYGGGERQRR